jgi:hypothetical protein
MVLKFKKYHLVIFVFWMGILLLSLPACHDAFNECLSGPGKTINERMGLYSFKNVSINDNIDLSIKNGKQYSLEITAGENIIHNLGIEIVNGTLNLSNKSTCALLKKPWDAITMILTVPELDTIFVKNHGRIQSQGIFYSQALLVRVTDSPAEVDLEIEATHFRLENMSGTANIKISGQVQNTECYHGGFGIIDLTNLHQQYLYLNMNSTNNSEIWGAEKYLFASLNNIGDVFYYREPAKIEWENNDSGQLIRAWE